MIINEIKNRLFKLGWVIFFTINSSQLWALEKNKTATPTDALLPMFGGLLVILIVIFGLAFLFKRFSNFGLASKNIKIIETQMIGNKEKLMIIQIKDQQFLIGVTGHTINQLGELKQTISLEDNASTAINNNTSTFSKVMSQFISSPTFNAKEQEKTSLFREKSL